MLKIRTTKPVQAKLTYNVITNKNRSPLTIIRLNLPDLFTIVHNATIARKVTHVSNIIKHQVSPHTLILERRENIFFVDLHVTLEINDTAIVVIS